LLWVRDCTSYIYGADRDVFVMPWWLSERGAISGQRSKTIQQTALEWQHIASTFYGDVMVSTWHLREHYVLYIT
jgi:hypothetical protein